MGPERRAVFWKRISENVDDIEKEWGSDENEFYLPAFERMMFLLMLQVAELEDAVRENTKKRDG